MTALGYPSPTKLEASRRWVAGSMLALLAIGTVMAHSTGVLRTKVRAGDPAGPLLDHLLKVAVALLACLLATRLRARHAYRVAYAAWAGTLVLLGLVLWLGEPVNNARRWLVAGGVTLQPSEFARVATMMAIAAWMAAARERSGEFRRGVLLPLGIAAVPAVLVLVEPDFGSSVYLLFMGALLLWVGGARARHLLACMLAVMAPLCLYAWGRLGHVRERFAGFLDPEPSSQVGQSLVALGHGGLFGVGLGAGPSKWGFLPEAGNDFVLSVLGEELGFLGTAAVVVLYALFVGHGVRLLLGLRSRFALVLGTGLLMQVGVQAALNLAVVTASAPPKGVPLPFISSGGSSALVLCFSTGLLLGLSRHPEEDPVSDARPAGARDDPPGR